MDPWSDWARLATTFGVGMAVAVRAKVAAVTALINIVGSVVRDRWVFRVWQFIWMGSHPHPASYARNF